MNVYNYEYQSDLVRKFVFQGREEGRTEQAIKAIFTVFRARGIPVSDDVRAHIESCRDVATLDMWLARAVTAATALDLLAQDREEGRTEQAVKSIFIVLGARGISVNDDVRARIETCTDVTTLDVWLVRAATAATAADVLTA